MPLHPVVIEVLLEALEARERFLCTQKIITTEEHSHYQKKTKEHLGNQERSQLTLKTRRNKAEGNN